MIAAVNSQVLAGELRMLNKIVPTKPSIAILSHVLLKATDEGIEFYATDLEVAMSSSCHARVTLPGSCALPMAKLLALVERFMDDDVNISLDKRQVVVSCGGFTTKLQALPAEDFPKQPPVEGDVNKLNVANLRDMIAKTRYAVAAGGSFHVLKGALLTLSGSVAAMAATDSKRLALATISREGTDQRFIVPAKTLDMLSAGTDSGEVDVAVGSQHLFFSLGTRQLVSRTIDGQFPKYERIIPRDHDRHVVVERATFASALRRVELIAEDHQAVFFNLEAGKMTLTAQNSSVGSATETIPAQYEGDPIRVCANGSYVLDFLDAAINPTIKLSLKEKATAALFTDGTDHVAVIMLMQS